MKRSVSVAIRASLILMLGASVYATGVPVARHMAGIVVLETVSAPARHSRADSAPLDLTPVFELAPFGRLATVDTPGQVTSTAMPDLRLRGVFVSDADNAAAMLDVDGQTGLYRIGQMVAADLTLSKVNRRFVELADATQTVTLHLDEDAESSAVMAQPNAPNEGTPSLFERLGSGLVVPALYQKPGPPETTSDYIDYWRTRIRKNPASVLEEIGLTSTDEGYVIADQHDVGVQLAGLRSGDLVRSVNGQAVGNPDDDRKLYDRIAASGQARLEVERDGRVLTFSFPLR